MIRRLPASSPVLPSAVVIKGLGLPWSRLMVARPPDVSEYLFSPVTAVVKVMLYPAGSSTTSETGIR